VDFISVRVIPPYGKRLIIATPLSENDIQQLEDRWSVLDPDNLLGGFYKVEYEKWNAFLIVFSLHHNQSISYGMLAHEALHIVDYLFQEIGHEYNCETNEPGAYLIEWLVNEIIKHFDEKKIISLLSYESIIKNKL
jgi:hypothetical protein